MPYNTLNPKGLNPPRAGGAPKRREEVSWGTADAWPCGEMGFPENGGTLSGSLSRGFCPVWCIKGFRGLFFFFGVFLFVGLGGGGGGGGGRQFVYRDNISGMLYRALEVWTLLRVRVHRVSGL